MHYFRSVMIAQKRNVYGTIGMTLIGACVGMLFVGYVLFLRPNVLVGRPAQTLVVAPGTLFEDLISDLDAQGYIASGFSFKTAARLMRLPQKALPGSYRLTSNMTNWDALGCLRAGLQTPIRITLSRARSLHEIASSLTHKICLDATTIEQILCNPAVTARYGLTPENVGVMFIPDTYEVYWNISAKALLDKMQAAYRAFWHAGRRQKAKTLGLTPEEVIILASLVACETNVLDEYPIIAGVYLNRLRRKMPLQSCPTLLHALGDPSIRRVLHAHKNVASPYNTYLHRGLPPGPICMPPTAVVEAVLNASSHTYLFFAAKDDFSGRHVFSSTLTQHAGHAKRYHRALNRRRIYR